MALILSQALFSEQLFTKLTKSFLIHSRTLEKQSLTCLFLRSLRAAKSSGASDGTLVTTPVPEKLNEQNQMWFIPALSADKIIFF